MRQIFITILVIFFGKEIIKAQNYSDSLDVKLEKLYQQKHLPGYAVAIVNNTEILYQNSFGFADLESKKPYTAKTVQSIASVSKTMLGFAIGKLIEENKIKLNTPINSILPYQVYHPKFPTVEITIKDLVTHTSGLIDNINSYDSRGKYFVEETKIDSLKLPKDDVFFINYYIAKNNKRSLEKHFHNLFSENGIWKTDSTWTNYKPGSYYQYSNLGSNLTSYIIELVAKQSYDKFINEVFFIPLKMNDTKWQENQVNPKYLSKSYRTSNMISSPIFGDNLYADGGVHTNMNNLSSYLIEAIKIYNGRSNLLKGKIFQQLFEAQLAPEVAKTNPLKKFKNIGVFWMLANDGSIYHNGGNPLGGTTYVSFDPRKNLGYILMCNYEIDTKESQLQFIYTWKNLLKYANHLNKK